MKNTPCHQVGIKCTEWKPEHGKGTASDGNTIFSRDVEYQGRSLRR